jgi:uncharacterized protein (TIGR00251 family)
MIYTVQVKPGSKKGPLVEAVDNHLTVYLQAKAIDGAANKQLVEVLSKHFGVRKSAVRIVHGEKSRIKHVEVS